MAQKSKKQVRKTPAVRSVARPAVEGMDTRSSAAVVSIPGSTSRSFSTEFNPDYSQTIKDLRRIAILAGSFFVILVALAFILP